MGLPLVVFCETHLKLYIFEMYKFYLAVISVTKTFSVSQSIILCCSSFFCLALAQALNMQGSSLSYSVVSPSLKTTTATNLSVYMKWNQGIKFLGGNKEMSGIISQRGQ